MSDSQTVTIPAAQHAATAETRPARLLRALAQNPEPLSPPPWPASWPNQAGAGDSCPPTTTLCAGTSRPATSNEQAASVTDAAGPPSSGASPPQAAAGSTTTTKHQPSPRPPPHKHGARPPNGTVHWTKPAPPSTCQTPRISRKRAAHQLRELGCTLDQIGAVFHVSKERIRQDLLWDPAARRPPRKPKPRTRLSPSQTQLLLGLSTSAVAEVTSLLGPPRRSH